MSPLSYRYSREQGVLLWAEEGETVLCYRADAPLLAIQELQRWALQPLALQCLDEASFASRLNQLYGQGQPADSNLLSALNQQFDLQQMASELPPVEELLASDDDAPVVRLINALFTEAVRRRASDIHIESYDSRMTVRMRVDGVMAEVLSPPAGLSPLLISRIKVMARLDIAEKRVPQDGRIALELAGRPLDVRVSTLPSGHGERVVMRLLDREAGLIGLAELGLPARQQQRLTALLEQPDGIVLVTGPTGSGKTTTLYAALQQLNDASRNILTVEDPIEYTLPGIGQTQVNSKVDMTFARGLRAMLRQDPDVVMVGEIRDSETVEVAIQASLTGHLVLSTLHTNDAVGALGRLHNMNAQPWLLASTLRGVLAQRLVRRLCTHCCQPEPLAEQQARQLGDIRLAGQSVLRAEGCERCDHSGYQGRIGLYELLVIDGPLREMLQQQASESDIRRYLQGRHSTLQDEARQRVLAGETSAAEAVRVVRSELNQAALPAPSAYNEAPEH
ncbi:MAG: type II secretion system ATPase GspE [Marinobacterium sp.]|nr:type II secretion system ATPase GspE [Marinobacterium sp.]